LSVGVLAVATIFAAGTVQAASTFNYLATPVDVSPSATGWQDVDVSSYVPVGATGVIVQFYNNSGDNKHYGVRKNGSSDGFFDTASKDGQQGWLMIGLDSNRVFEVYTETVGAVETYLIGYTMLGVTFLDNRVSKSLGSTGSWQDIDISGNTGSATAIGAIFIVHNSDGSSQTYGLRKKGSSDDRVEILRADTPTVGIIGVDKDEVAQMEIGNTAVDLYLVGYVTSGAVFFTNAINKSTGSTGSYQSVDITANIGSDDANGAIVEVYPSAGGRELTALRPTSASSYDKFLDVDHSFALVGIDSSDVFEQKIDNTDTDLYLIGYTLENCNDGTYWNCDWEARRQITFDNTGRGDLDDFPVLICLTDPGEVDYSNTQNSGQDLRFVDADNSTVLNHEIEQWNESGTSYVWVKVPRIDSGSTTDFIYMYYGNTGASAPSQASQDATWSNNFDAVYHLHDDFLDSTSNSRDGTNNGSSDVTSNRLAGDSQSFRGTGNDDYINTNWAPSYASNEDFVLEGWFRSDDTVTRTDDILGIEDRFGGAGDESELRLAIRENTSGGQNVVDAWDNLLWTNSAKTYSNATSLDINANEWYHVALVRDGGTARTYLNGSQVHSASVNTSAISFPTRSPWSTTNALLIGAQWQTDGSDGTIRNRYEGELDEIRASSGTARNADWFDATYETIINCGTFSDISVETTSVSVVSFEAEAGDQEVELVWRTGSELSNHGFHLYRATKEDGDYSRISSNVIPGLGSSAEGAEYSYLDTGLTNGKTYYYVLEDVAKTGATRMHGPVSATPAEGVYGGDGDGDSEESETSRVTYGKPWENEVRLRRLGNRAAVLELITEGFYAYPDEDGTVRLEVPGLELVSEPGDPAIPVYQGWIEAVVGRRVKLRNVRADNVQEFTGLRPTAADVADIGSSGNGVVRLHRKAKRAFLRSDGLYPKETARLVEEAFQEDLKKVLVELAPLRWDERGQRLILAHHLRVRIQFSGREPTERLIDGGKGRRHVENHASRRVLTQLVTREPGLHAVQFEDIFGRRGRPRRTSELRLSRQGNTVAFRVVPRSRTFARGSTLYFVSEGADANPYGNEAVYELEVSRSGLVMEKVNAAPFGSLVSRYWTTLSLEQNRYYQSAYVEAEDIWQWDWIFGPMTKSYAFQVENLHVGSESSSLDLWLQGASAFPQLDHHSRVYVNGTLVAEEWWDGESPLYVTAELGAGVLHEGENVLQIQEVGDTPVWYSMIMLDRFEVKYPSELVLGDGSLEGSFDQSGTAWVSGPASAYVLDVTGDHPQWLSGVNHEEGVGFGALENHRYLVVSPEGLLSPEIRQPLQTSLRSDANAAEYLVIGPRAFLNAAEPLLRYRMNEGLRTKAVVVEDIFAEFGYGETTPDAIRDFLSYVYHHWSDPSLRYVLLLGDATYDPKDYLMTGVENHVPAKLVKTRYLWTASDPWLAAVNGEDLLPDIAVGRLPAASVDEVELLVEKILAYEAGEADPGAPVVLVTDNPDGAGDFEWNADVLADTVLSDQNVEKIYLSKLGTTATRSAILNAFDGGASVMSYIGHGAIHLWADENLLNIGQMDSLSPQSQQPILFTMNCLNGYFHFPYHDSLSEALLKAEGKGVIAAFSPTGLSLDEPAHRFHRALLDHVLHQDHQRLGDAILAGQSDYADSGAFPELLSIYHLLGDPALKLR